VVFDDILYHLMSNKNDERRMIEGNFCIGADVVAAIILNLNHYLLVWVLV
jgi:hypothetical protein